MFPLELFKGIIHDTDPLYTNKRILYTGEDMAQIPANVLAKMAEQTTVKTLVTASKSGRPHAIVCGSILSPSPDKIIVGEVLMKRASANLQENPKAAVLVCAGMESYEIALSNPVRIAEGPVLEQMNEGLAKVHLQARAVWMFDVCAVFNESATPEAGTKIA